MKTDYKKIAKLHDQLQDAVREYGRYANLNIGVISGGYDLTEERDEINRLNSELICELAAAAERGARKSKLAEYGWGRDMEWMTQDDIGGYPVRFGQSRIPAIP